MQIEDERAVDREHAEKSVLNLEMARFETAVDSGQREHRRCKDNGSPIVCAEGPCGSGGGKSAKIGMDYQEFAIERAAERFFPARTDV